jgi:hypothetical protein
MVYSAEVPLPSRHVCQVMCLCRNAGHDLASSAGAYRVLERRPWSVPQRTDGRTPFAFQPVCQFLMKQYKKNQCRSSVRPSSRTADCWFSKSLGSPRVMTCKKIFYALCKIKLFAMVFLKKNICHGEMHKAKAVTQTHVFFFAVLTVAVSTQKVSEFIN